MVDRRDVIIGQYECILQKWNARNIWQRWFGNNGQLLNEISHLKIKLVNLASYNATNIIDVIIDDVMYDVWFQEALIDILVEAKQWQALENIVRWQSGLRHARYILMRLGNSLDGNKQQILPISNAIQAIRSIESNYTKGM